MRKNPILTCAVVLALTTFTLGSEGEDGIVTPDPGTYSGHYHLPAQGPVVFEVKEDPESGHASGLVIMNRGKDNPFRRRGKEPEPDMYVRDIEGGQQFLQFFEGGTWVLITVRDGESSLTSGTWS